MLEKLEKNNGFSLVELLIGLMLLGVVLAAGYSLYISANKSQKAQDMEVDMQQNARSAADFVVREMRNIIIPNCLDNTATLCSPTSDKITFTSMADTDTRIFSWSASDNILRFSKAAVGNPDRQPLADNITAFALTPLDANNNSTTTLSNVRRIDVTITARTSQVDPNTNGYRTYSIKTSVMKRN
jgi:prepilin-type N-terminal cleavage/methylation domain-containing protein